VSVVFSGDELIKIAIDIERRGISAEKDSLLFYYEMKENVPHHAAPVIDRIIAEEKLHLRQLSEVKKRLAAPGEPQT